MKKLIVLFLTVLMFSSITHAAGDRYSIDGLSFTMPGPWAFDYDGTDENAISFRLQNGYFQAQAIDSGGEKVNLSYLTEFLEVFAEDFEPIEQHSFNLHDHIAEYRRLRSSDDLIYEVAAAAGDGCTYCCILAYPPDQEEYFTDFLDRILISATIEERAEEMTEPVALETERAASKTELTAGQQNALDSANSYLSFTAFSRSGLIEQLEYEGYSNSDATFAADHCGADWDEQAYKSAKSYLEYSSFSLSGLIDQLEYEGFTSSQAQYGANKAYNE